MLSELEKDKLKLLVYEILRDDADKFDFKSYVDSSLTFEENKTIILDKLDMFKETQISKEIVQEQQILTMLNNQQHNKNIDLLNKISDKIKVMMVYGGTGSGKTCFCYKLIQKYKDKQVYVFNSPIPHIISKMGYKNMLSLGELSRLNNIVLWLDEVQLSFRRDDKRSNETFLMLCSLARQKDITLIFSTSDTRWVNKGLESYVSHWIIKDIDVSLIKQGSAIKKIIRNVMPLAGDELSLTPDEYIAYSKVDNIQGLFTFVKPIYYNDTFSKAYKNI